VTCHDAREKAAVALISRQQPDRDTARHLAQCPDCAREAERLAPLPALLDLVADPALRHPDPPGEHLLERMLTQVRRRRRIRRVALAAAAAAVATAVPVGWEVVHEQNETYPPAAVATGPAVVASAHDAATGVWAKVELRRAAWGSDLTFDIGGVPAGTRCRLLALTRGGDSQVAGSWTATAGKSWTVHGSVAADAAQITRIELVEEKSGRVLLPVTVL
jgi:hypothetical protein